jgi:MFS family permease
VSQPTRIRYGLLAVATANAFLLYLDRICMSAIVQTPAFQSELKLTRESTGDILATFFFAYALGQLPAGYLADRFGPRKMLVTYIFLWSLATAFTGLTSTLFAMLAVRAACGLAEAGAYPASALVISRWFPLTHRARANSVVSFGGRIGNALALWLTALAIASFGSWRTVLVIYGIGGLVLAAVTHVIFRDRPADHPLVNDAEREMIGPPPPSPPPTFPIRQLSLHPGLWLLNLGMLGLNFGWAFLITWLPTYLMEVRGLDQVTASRNVSIALAAGMAGMLFGGWWCDQLTQRFGLKWGRRLPFLTGCSLAALAYISCPFLPSAAAVTIACAVVAFSADSVMPAVWAIGQDIGGSNVASTIAWSNMWGNFGASMVAKLIPMIIATTWHQTSWSEIFWICAGAFVMLAVCSLAIDSTRTLQVPRSSAASATD